MSITELCVQEEEMQGVEEGGNSSSPRTTSPFDREASRPATSPRPPTSPNPPASPHPPTSPVDDTLEPDSEDELFINEGPNLEDEDSYPGGGQYEDSSTFLDDEDTTYGSPGLREAFGDGFGAGSAEQDSSSVDLDSSRTGSADLSRKNKRKNFRPRNIIYSNNDSDGEEKTAGGQDNSPMDLSVAGRPQLDSDSESETGQAAPKAPKIGGLSVVRPEILFGNNKPPTSEPATTEPNPLSILTALSGMSGLMNPFARREEATAATMKDAFREVLKLYGMSSEMADTITQNSSNNKPG